jgi:hypothetical protein
MKKSLLVVMLLVCASVQGEIELNALSCGCATDREVDVPLKPGPWRKAIPIPTGLVTACMHLSPETSWILMESKIVDQEYDLMLWKQLSVSHYHLQDSAILNPVQCGAYSSQEYVMIEGKLGRTSSGSKGATGTASAFRLTVPSVDVDWESYPDKIKDEPGEDGRLVYLPVTADPTQHRMISIKTPRDDFSKVHPIMTLSWTPADKARLWRTDGTEFVNGGGIDARKIIRDEGGFPFRLRVEPLNPCAELKITLKGEKDDFAREKAEDSVKACLYKIEVTNIKFNHDTAACTNDAVNLRKDSNTRYDLPDGEWVKGGQNLPACYVKGKSVKIRAKFSVQPATVTRALIWAEPTVATGTLKRLISKIVIFNGGVADDVSFQMDGLTPDSIRRTETNIWQWKIMSVNAEPSPESKINASGPHTIYTILQEPQEPWDNQWQNSKNLWSVVLDKTCTDPWAGGCKEEMSALSNITYAAYHNYGKSYYCRAEHCNGKIWHLSGLMSDMDLDCQGMSAIVHLFGRAVGCPNIFVQKEMHPFQTKEIKLVGPTVWLSSRFEFHQFAVVDVAVYDACVQLKAGGSPYLPIKDTPLNYCNNIRYSGLWYLDDKFPCTDFD